MMRRQALAALGVWLCMAGAGFAAPRNLEPRKPIDLDRFMGRWYEILRTPNMAQKNCYAASQLWSKVSPGRLSIVQLCHRGSAKGSEHRVKTGVRVLDPPVDAKFQASFFGGLIRRDYTVMDHADDYDWMIACTSNGKYVSVLAREPGLPSREVAALTARVAALGLDAGRLVPVGAAAD
jgi:apolipoprotein D and lipocalin family protein